jgi:hypothetical protein
MTTYRPRRDTASLNIGPLKLTLKEHNDEIKIKHKKLPLKTLIVAMPCNLGSLERKRGFC